MSDKILLVDDEPTLLETLAFNLRNAGYQVTDRRPMGRPPLSRRKTRRPTW